jgi:hypothetical protein
VGAAFLALGAAVRAGRVRSTGALTAYTRAFAYLELRDVLPILKAKAAAGDGDDSESDDDGHGGHKPAVALRVPSARDARPLAMAQPDFAALDDKQQRAAVERQRQLLLKPVAAEALARLFRPGRAPRVPRGGRFAGVSTDGISGTFRCT